MQNQGPWDAGSFLRTAKLDLSLAQFLHFSPKARAAMAEAIRLEPNPKKTRQKTTRFAEPIEIPDVDEEMEEISNNARSFYKMVLLRVGSEVSRVL